MPNIIPITELDRPELDVYARLTQAQLRSRRHPERALFVAESHTVIAHALDAGVEPVSFLMERRQLEGPAGALLERCGQVPVYVGERALLERLTGYALTRGVLCAMRRPAPCAPERVCQGVRRLAVLEGLTDPTNVGAVFRSAAALGVDAVLLNPTCCDPLHRRAVRVSMGAVFQVPWARLGGGEVSWPSGCLAWLHGLGFTTAALALTDRSIGIEDPGLAQTSKLALLLGAEGDGLNPETIAQCGCTVKIPMSHGVDSLNVAAASAVAFWQLRAR